MLSPYAYTCSYKYVNLLEKAQCQSDVPIATNSIVKQLRKHVILATI